MTMKLNGIKLNFVRNEYEYNKYVSEEYKKRYDYEASKSSLPWLIISFDKGNSPENVINKCKLTFEPEASFDSINKNEAWQANGHTLNIDLDKIEKTLMLEVKKDCGYQQLPFSLKASVSDNNGVLYEDAFSIINVTDKAELLKLVDEKLIIGGGCDSDLAKLLYELIAQGGN